MAAFLRVRWVPRTEMAAPDEGSDPPVMADSSTRRAGRGGAVSEARRRLLALLNAVRRLRPLSSERQANELGRDRRLFAVFWAVAPPLDFQILGRTLLHTALVGLAAGLVGAAFFAGLEHAQRLFLDTWAGFTPLRAHGENIVRETVSPVFRPWLIVILPAAGGLVAGLVTELAPEARGGGGDATIHAFHHQGGFIRRRVMWVKAIASIFTLGTGGSGGREGPTMQIGAALGSTVGRLLRVSPREQRVLMVAGVAAGLSAVFRTPLGAALLAAEVLYRDDFEAEALVPAVLASVIAYSVVISIFGESILFARAARYPFVPAHLPLYALLAVLITVVASTFLSTLRAVQRWSAALRLPAWAKPALGGLALGAFALPIIVVIGTRYGGPGRGLGILGGGYGAAQVAITGASWLPAGWGAVAFLLFLCGAKLFATSLTIGSGGSAGDFGPSLVLGGLFGGAFGRAAALLLDDPRIDPGAFALVGMGTFYGGLAHVPLSALILVNELAGSYDLLVPAMLAEGIAFVALRRRSLYLAQPTTRRDSPVHQAAATLEVLPSVRVADVVTPSRLFRVFEPRTPIAQVIAAVTEASWQSTFPVLEGAELRGLVTAEAVQALRTEHALHTVTNASDLMQAPVAVRPADDLRTAAAAMLMSALKQVPVIASDGAIVGFLEEVDVTRAYVAAMSGDGRPPPGEGR
jgi:chloride channel protein, CIC family